MENYSLVTERKPSVKLKNIICPLKVDPVAYNCKMERNETMFTNREKSIHIHNILYIYLCSGHPVGWGLVEGYRGWR